MANIKTIYANILRGLAGEAKKLRGEVLLEIRFEGEYSPQTGEDVEEFEESPGILLYRGRGGEGYTNQHAFYFVTSSKLRGMRKSRLTEIADSIAKRKIPKNLEIREEHIGWPLGKLKKVSMANDSRNKKGVNFRPGDVREPLNCSISPHNLEEAIAF